MVWRFRQASDLGIFALEVFKIILKERNIALFFVLPSSEVFSTTGFELFSKNFTIKECLNFSYFF